MGFYADGSDERVVVAPREESEGAVGWGESVAAHEGSQFVDRVVAKPVSAEALMEQLAELRRTRAPAP